MSEDSGTLVATHTLADLIMRSGPISDVLGAAEKDWNTIAKALSDVYLKYQKDLGRKDYVAHLCNAYYAHGKKRHVRELAEAAYTDQLYATLDLLEKFMTGVGQWDYIKSRDWYRSGAYVIAIDVNYYPDRSDFKAATSFHKDTGGNNIFVNLLFDNKTEIEATEWYADLNQPSAKRLLWQKGLLPDSHMKDLTNAREALAELVRKGEKTDGYTEVSGGVSKGLNTFVSWVDDLVWHSTPSERRRIEFSAEVARTVYGPLNNAAKGYFYYVDKTLDAYVIGSELLGSIAQEPATHLAGWLTKKNLTVQDIDDAVAEQAWADLYAGAGKAKYEADIVTRGKQPWRLTGAYSEANAPDRRLAKSVSIKEPPVGLSGIRRANSLDKNKAALDKARTASANEARTFLRTWVRILPKNSSELNDVKLVDL